METENKPEKLTQKQFDSLHLWFRQTARSLRDQHVDMRKLMFWRLQPTEHILKEDIFKPILLAMFGKTSTKELNKQKEIDDIYDTICKSFADEGISVPPFPHDVAEENSFNQTYDRRK